MGKILAARLDFSSLWRRSASGQDIYYFL